MKNVYLLLCGLLTGITSAVAQTGAVGVGLRLSPDGIGLTGKYFLHQDVSLESQLNTGGIIALQGKSFNTVALIEYYIQLPDTGWRLFFGGGVHAGIWNRYDVDYYTGERRSYNDNNQFILGIDGVGGIEYTLKKAPIRLSADIKPAINLLSDLDFFSHNMLGISVRYYFRK